ncbi:PQQ-binding-like beta-propeller repeat protein [Phormidium sp. FACHB-1136]|uniref:PQQ-binding-like beta-propeller repeat protein n=1 Tax=Phormidium sp. FACHB-1136 TaxID=2692848 RepID=UPI001687E847|nr:PQQ-binding-like beta-propeller repeat protein [Phormidium sp. FACHB-1136]MBD2429283.1 PQQ-binding-like beta-propeller repeat protein [Phormidium sp. FACHB-1136]
MLNFIFYWYYPNSSFNYATPKTEGRVGSSPAIADGVVYFGSVDGHLYAVE